MNDTEEGLTCVVGGMTFAPTIARILRERFDGDQDDTDPTLTYTAGGKWYCPGCGVEMFEQGGNIRCPTCKKTLNCVVYPLIELHPHHQ